MVNESRGEASPGPMASKQYTNVDDIYYARKGKYNSTVCIYNSGTNVYYVNASFKGPGATLVPLSVGKTCCIYICGISNLMACIPAIIVVVISIRDLLDREGLYNMWPGVSAGSCA